ncbi:MAG TPA: hypothetical protein VN982_03935 [Candidatus Dormibacteraeota bacterium]|nr:hypothetical protein [Candidatus Dormibacteraeota bacterium]
MPFRLSVLPALLTLTSASLLAQQTNTTSAQASIMLQQSLHALAPSVSVADVSLSGSARRIAGSDDETGTVALKAISGGAARMDANFSSGQRSEVQNLLSGSPVGSWSGPDGIFHPMAYHNLMTDPCWFFPTLAISRTISTSSYASAYIGRETRNGQSVEHVQVWQATPVQTPVPIPGLQHFSQMDLYLDSTTLLPASLTFQVHPDNNMSVDIFVEVLFSDYRAISGVQVPFRVQKYLNNGLALDLQLETATINSGLSASLFLV